MRLSGWVHRKRDHGQLLFIDLRDHYGITQIVFQPEDAFFAEAESVRLESVLTVTGRVVARSDETVNSKLATGEVELVAEDLSVESPADTLPLQVNAERDFPEETRLRYRFLDLRREVMHQNILLRSRIISSIRRRMEAQGFVEFQTPILTASSPEGARDFLVPSRLHPGKFYALPQAPQQYKQLFMMSGFDRYFQIAPCFRDEDARADRSPGEFYQLDLEMAFVGQEDVFAAVEPVMHGLFTEFSDWDVTPTPFPRIPYREAMVKYGSDKPDLRNPIAIADVGEIFAGGGFAVFAKAVAGGAVVRAVPAPGAVGRPRSFFDQMVAFAQSLGAPGLGYIQYGEGEPRGPVAKFLDPERIARIRQAAALQDGDAVFFVCAKPKEAERLSGLIRTRLGEDLGLIAQDCYRFAWVVDFPMFEWNEDTKSIEFSHNPFSMPQGGLEALEIQGSARDRGLPVRHRLQRHRAVLGRHPQPSPGHHGQGVRDRRLRPRGGRGALRRHVPRVPLRRAAARRAGTGHRPDRHAARAHPEPARDHGVPAQSAGAGARARRAERGRRQAAARAQPPALARRTRSPARGAGRSSRSQRKRHSPATEPGAALRHRIRERASRDTR